MRLSPGGRHPDFPWLATGEVTCAPTFELPQDPVPVDTRVIQFFEDCARGIDEQVMLLCTDGAIAFDAILTRPTATGAPERNSVTRTQCEPGTLPPGIDAVLEDGLTIRGLGPVRIGDRLDDIQSTLDIPVRVPGPGDSGGWSCFFVRLVGVDGLTLWVNGDPVSDPGEGQVSAILVHEVEGSSPAAVLGTRSGLRVGDPVGRVVELYGNDVAPFTDEYGSEHFVLLIHDAADADFGMRISHFEGIVTQVTAGRHDTVSLQEGCS